MILWLTEKKGYSVGVKAVLEGLLQKNGCQAGSVIYYSLHNKVPSLGEYGKKPKIPFEHNITAARHILDQQCNGLKPSIIVVNDEPSLRAITLQPYTLATTRGSVYKFNSIPVLVLDDLQRGQFDYTQKFTLHLDIAKLIRYALGKPNLYPEFDYHLAASWDEVREKCSRAKRATFVSVDTETHSKFITVVAFTYDVEGRLETFSVPFFDPHSEDGVYWKDEKTEIAVRVEIAALMDHTVIKAFQNGTYDLAYFLKEGMPVRNYYLDSENLMHCIWMEMPKKLHELASYWCDAYTYWKDDGKGVKEDGWGKNRDTLHKYWRYCGLDTYYTWLVCYFLLGKLVRQKWSVDNYRMEFALSVGPCLEESLRGVLVDNDAHGALMDEQVKRSLAGRQDICELTHEEGFNINRPADVAWFLYDFCHQKPTRLQYLDPAKKGRKKYGPRSIDEHVLKIMKEQNNGLSAIARNFIDRYLKAKKPGTVLSNYQELNFLTMRGRFVHKHNAAGTDTFRFNSGKNQFWVGRNLQNHPEWLREFLKADTNYVLYSVDYSASDDRFIAYECEDPEKMQLVESDKDPHCFHASVFFAKPYIDLYNGWKAKSRWVVHPTEGIRQNTKRVTHGRNFMMEAETLYNTMGRDAVVATARTLGYERALAMNDKELIGICQILADKYDHPRTGLYKRLRPWQGEMVELCKKNANRYTNTFGLTRWFLGSMNDPDNQRALISCYGQMNTAGNINRALDAIYYQGICDAKNCIFLQQGHDSLLFLLHKDAMHEKISVINSIMVRPTTIHGRSVSIPVDGKVGIRWSEEMVKYRSDLTYSEIFDFDRKTFGEKYPPRNAQAMLDKLAAMDFGNLGTPGISGERQVIELSDDFEDDEELDLV